MVASGLVGNLNTVTSEPLTQWLQQWRQGDELARDRLIEQLYGQLRGMAQNHLNRENSGHTLQATDLVHEAYQRIALTDIDWADRSHFLAVMAQVMRRMLIDHAKAKHSAKRGAGERPLRLDDIHTIAADSDAYFLEANEALAMLGLLDKRKESVMEMRFFGGMSSEEIGKALNISIATVERDIRMAKAWLKKSLSEN